MTVTIQNSTLDGVGETLLPTGKKLSVPYTMEGDVVLLSDRFCKKKRTKYSFFETIDTPSKERKTPMCRHFSHCGGCSLQHMPYEKEAQLKEAYVHRLFPQKECKLHPILKSETEWCYRNKMEFSFSQNKEGEKFLGLMMSYAKRRVINTTECFLVDPWFVEVLKSAREWWEKTSLQAQNSYHNTGTLISLGVRKSFATNDRVIILTVSSNPEYAPKKSDLESFSKAVQKASEGYSLSVILRIHQAMKGHPTSFYEMTLFGPPYFHEEVRVNEQALLFQISPSAFFQPNSQMASRLISRAFELGDIQPTDTVYDLYCGSGIIGMCAAMRAKQVIGIELSKDGVYDATVNKERLALTNYTIYSGDVGKVLEEHSADLPPPDVIIIDPPRSGMDMKAIQAIVNLKPKKIIAISCNPATQSANIALLEQHGYHVQHVQPVDQFPHTPHVENIVICHQN